MSSKKTKAISEPANVTEASISSFGSSLNFSSINIPSYSDCCIIPHHDTFFCTSKFCFSMHTREMDTLKKTLNEMEEVIKQKDKIIADSTLKMNFLNNEYDCLRNKSADLYVENQSYKNKYDDELNRKKQKI